MKTVLSLFVLLAASTFSSAQTASSMTGTITDANGAAVPNATVTIINSDAGVGLISTTDTNGQYRFTNLPAGAGYMAIFAHAGFASLRVSNIKLSAATTLTQNTALTAGPEIVMNVSATPQVVSSSPATSSPSSLALPWLRASWLSSSLLLLGLSLLALLMWPSSAQRSLRWSSFAWKR